MKKIYTVLHSHRFGIDVYLVTCNRLPTVKEVIKAHNISFENNRDDERLEIDEAGEIVNIF